MDADKLIVRFLMKLICKCENVDELKPDKPVETFKFKDCCNGTFAFLCKKLNEVVYINSKSD